VRQVVEKAIDPGHLGKDAFHGQVVLFPALVALDGEGKELFLYVGKNNSDRLSPRGFTPKLAVAGV